jgi:hypothetical protein
MMAAFESGLWPGVDGYPSARTTYGQFYSFFSAMDLALVTFAVGKRTSFLAKVHGQSVLRHGQSFARNSRFQRTLGASARTGHGFHLSSFGMTPFGLRASSRVRPTRKDRRPDDRGRSEKAIGPRGSSRSARPCFPPVNRLSDLTPRSHPADLASEPLAEWPQRSDRAGDARSLQVGEVFIH